LGKKTSAGSRNWYSIASDTTGAKLAAVVNNGYIYTSSDSGETWATSTGSGVRFWRSIVSDTTGTKLAAVANGEYIYTSTDSGFSWATSSLSVGSRNWYSITSDASGTKLAAVVYNGYIYTSVDSGVTWSTSTSAGSRYWKEIKYSSDGTRLVASTASTEKIYFSNDNGLTWVNRGVDGIWRILGFNSQGNKVFVSSSGSSIADYINAIDFTFDISVNQYIKINSPILNAVLTIQSWLPSVEWGFNKTTCQYSYNNWVSTSTANCVLGGSDILPPQSEGSNTLYLRSVDAINNVSITSVLFKYFSNGWNLRDLNKNITSISTDISGRKLVALTGSSVTYDYINTSNDGGLSWIERISSTKQNWQGLASDALGVKLAAIGSDGYIYLSIDSGINWTKSTYLTSRSWSSITSSADGSYLAGTVNNDYMYFSTDFGATWATSTGSIALGKQAWQKIASSVDGKKLIAAVYNGYIYTSEDYGVTWATSTSAGLRYWKSVDSSADGSTLVAVVGGNGGMYDGRIYTSYDRGVNWVPRDSSRSWWDVTVSTDGSKMAAMVRNSNIYNSTDAGVTWSPSTGSDQLNWKSITSSADGNKLFAAVPYSGVYVHELLTQSMAADILLPQNLAITTAWNPIISWSTATSCYYSYDNWVSTSTANCALNGSDITPPSTSGTVTLYIKGIDAGAVVKTNTSTFTYAPHYWCGTADSSWTNVSNWYTDATCSVNKGSIPTNTSGVFLVENTSPIISWSTTTLPLFINSTGLTGGANTAGVIFGGTAYNSTKIVGNATFNGTSYNAGEITGNAIFSAASNGTFSLSGTMKWDGTIAGTIKGGDTLDITNLLFNNSSSNETTIGNTIYAVFNDSASNNGTIDGNATFNNTGLFTMGTVNGTTTMSGLSQTLNGVNNVVNLVKNIATVIRDTLFITSGSILNISGGTTIQGYDANNLLTIQSTIPGIQASLGINGTSTLNYLRIRDINNTGANINLSTNTVFNDGGNTGFTFDGSKAMVPREGMTSSYLNGTDPIFPGTINSCGNLYFAGTYTLGGNVVGSCNIGVPGVIINGAGHALTGDITANEYGVTLSNITVTGVVSTTGAGVGTITINNASNLTGSLTITGFLAGDGSSSVASTTIDGNGVVATSSVSFVGEVKNNGIIYSGNFVGNLTNNGTIENSTTSPVIALGNTLNNGVINGGFVLNSNSTNHGTINGNVVLNDNSINSGTVNGTVSVYDSSLNTGIVTGDLILNSISSASGVVSFGTTTNFLGTGRVMGAVRDQASTTITKWIFNGGSTNSGYTKGMTFFNGTSTNSGTILGHSYFNNSSINTGTITGDADVYYFVTTPLGGTVTGTTTYYSYPNTKTFNNSAGDGMWNNSLNWFTDTTLQTNLGGLPASGEAVVLFSSTTLLSNVNNDVYIGANNITIDGVSGKNIGGFISGNGAYDGGNAFNFNLFNLTVTGTTSANGADNSNGVGGKGGNINISASITANVIANGGYGTLGSGDGGTITVTNPITTGATNGASTGGASNGRSSGTSGGSQINLGLANNLNLSNPERSLININSNFGLPRRVVTPPRRERRDPPIIVVQIRPVIVLKDLPKISIDDALNNFLDDSLPEDLVDLSNAVPSIKKELRSSSISGGYILYRMKESPVNTPTLKQFLSTRTQQPYNLIFVSVDGVGKPTKLSIDAKGNLYQIVNVASYSAIGVTARENSEKVIVTFNGKETKFVKDNKNIVKVNVVVPGGGGTNILKIGKLTLEVRVDDTYAGSERLGEIGTTAPIKLAFYWFRENVNNFIKAVRR
jgi:hypothetical protein